MNSLQKLIQLRGLTVKDVAAQIGYGYHNVQKIVKRSTRPTKAGGIVRTNYEIEAAVAKVLGLSHEQCWGDHSEAVLKRLIKQEIAARASETADKLREQYL